MRARNALSESPSILGCSGRRTSTRMYSQLGRAIHVALSPRQPDRVAGPARWGLPVWRPSCPQASGAAKSVVIRGRSARTGTFRRGSCHLPFSGRPRGGRLRVARRARRPARTVPPSQGAAPHTAVAAAAGAAGSPRQRSFLVACFAGDVLEVADVVAGLKVGDRAGELFDREGRQVVLAGEEPEVGVAFVAVVDGQAVKLRADAGLQRARVRFRWFGCGLPALPW